MGPENAEALREAGNADLIVCAWGNHVAGGWLKRRAAEMIEVVAGLAPPKRAFDYTVTIFVARSMVTSTVKLPWVAGQRKRAVRTAGVSASATMRKTCGAAGAEPCGTPPELATRMNNSIDVTMPIDRAERPAAVHLVHPHGRPRDDIVTLVGTVGRYARDSAPATVAARPQDGDASSGT